MSRVYHLLTGQHLANCLLHGFWLDPFRGEQGFQCWVVDLTLFCRNPSYVFDHHLMNRLLRIAVTVRVIYPALVLSSCDFISL